MKRILLAKALLHIFAIVGSRKESYIFGGSVHLANSTGKFHLDPITFYKKYGGSTPECPHHEIEITDPSPPELKKFRLHLEYSRKNGLPFMCYPFHIPTPDRAYDLFRVWCLGSVMKIVEGVDLNTIYDSPECKGDPAKFAVILCERFKIKIVEEKVL